MTPNFCRFRKARTSVRSMELKSAPTSPRRLRAHGPELRHRTLQDPGRLRVQLLRTEPSAGDGLGEPGLERAAAVDPVIVTEVAVERSGQHVDAIVRLPPPVGGVPAHAERLADQLVERLAEVLVQQALQRRVAPLRI